MAALSDAIRPGTTGGRGGVRGGAGARFVVSLAAVRRCAGARCVVGFCAFDSAGSSSHASDSARRRVPADPIL